MAEAEAFKAFTEADDEKALTALREKSGIVGHIIEGDTYIAKLMDGRLVRISMTLTMHDYDAISGNQDSAEEDGLKLIEKLAKRANNKTPLDSLPLLTVTSVISDYTSTLDRALGLDLGKSQD